MGSSCAWHGRGKLVHSLTSATGEFFFCSLPDRKTDKMESRLTVPPKLSRKMGTLALSENSDSKCSEWEPGPLPSTIASQIKQIIIKDCCFTSST